MVVIFRSKFGNKCGQQPLPKTMKVPGELYLFINFPTVLSLILWYIGEYCGLISYGPQETTSIIETKQIFHLKVKVIGPS